MTTVLGFLFVAGQLVAWRQLVAQGVYIASNQASSFFYIFTGAHAVHLLGGVGALLFVGFRKFEKQKSRFRQPRKSPLTTGISWMDFGFSCWPCFTWESEILVAGRI